MAIKNLGYIGIVPKGDYNPATPYNKLNLVRGDNGSYVSLKNDNLGNDLTDPTYWQLMTTDGGGSYFIQSDTVLTYSDLIVIGGSLTPDDANKAYVLQSDNRIYVWDGSAFPDDGQGIVTKGDNGDNGANGTAIIPDWEELAYILGANVYRNGKIWKSNAITTASDVPGVSPLWVQKTGNIVVKNQFWGVGTVASGTSGLNRTYFIDPLIPIDSTIVSLSLHCHNATTIKVKRFTPVGANYVYKNETAIVVPIGISTSALNLAVKAGDVIALYTAAGGISQLADPLFLGIKGNVGDITTDIAYASIPAAASSLQAKFKIEYSEVIDDIEDGEEPALTDIILVPCFGQSLAINTNAGASTFASPVSIAYDVNNVNTNLQDMNGGFVEMFLELSKEFKALPSGFKLMTSVSGSGGTSILNLSKGTAQYNNLLTKVTTGKNTAASLGKTFSVPAFMWTQGEEDYRCGGSATSYGTGVWDPLTYAAKLKQLVDDLNTDIKKITGQTKDVLCVLYQTASHNPYKRYPRIALQQLKASMADERIIVSKAMYDVVYDVADQVHAPAKTYRNMGNFYGMAAYKAIVLNENVSPIFPVSHKLVSNALYIKFHVANKPLTFDTTLVTALADGNKGFNLLNVTNETAGTTGTIAASGVTITNVEIVKDDVVKITFSGVPTSGHRLTYGVNGTGWDNISGVGGVAGKSGNVDGARGNLRDNQNYLSINSDYFWLHNWSPIFEIVI